jgi:hypothetical protein
MQSWINEAKDVGLQRVAHIHSMWQEGDPYFDPDFLNCRFRADAAVPGDQLNQPFIDALTGKLLELRKDLHGLRPYLDLQLGRRWQEGDLPTLAGRMEALLMQVQGKGGVTSIWPAGLKRVGIGDEKCTKSLSRPDESRCSAQWSPQRIAEPWWLEFFQQAPKC